MNVYNWAEYIGETTIADFEKEFDIKVTYDTTVPLKPQMRNCWPAIPVMMSSAMQALLWVI